jgi:hypothetical protein
MAGPCDEWSQVKWDCAVLPRATAGRAPQREPHVPARLPARAIVAVMDATSRREGTGIWLCWRSVADVQRIAQCTVQLGSLDLLKAPERCRVERRLRHREEVVAGDDAGDGKSLVGSDLDL